MTKAKNGLANITRLSITKDDAMTVIALMIIYENQTVMEKKIGSTILHNNVGFNATDAKRLTKIAEHYMRYGKISQKMMEVLKAKMPKYSRQIVDFATS